VTADGEVIVTPEHGLYAVEVRRTDGSLRQVASCMDPTNAERTAQSVRIAIAHREAWVVSLICSEGSTGERRAS